MHPLDDVVANIHRIGARGQHLDLERSGRPAGGLERLIPPCRAVDQRRADRFGRAAIDVVLKRVLRLTGSSAVGIFLDEAVAHDELLIERVAERRGVIPIHEIEVAGAWIVAARQESRTRQLDEGLMFAQRHGVRVGRDIADEGTLLRRVGSEGQNGFDFDVFRKGARGVEREDGTGGIEFVGVLMLDGEQFRDVVRVAQKEFGGVDENGADLAAVRIVCLVLGGDRKGRQDRFRKRLAHRELLVAVGGCAAKGFIGLDQQHLGAEALEANDAAFGDLAAVQA